MLRSTAFVLSIWVLGCGQQPAEPQPFAAVSVAAAQNPTTDNPPDSAPNTPAAPATKTPPDPPKESTSTFEYPADLGGKIVVKAVAPDVPALTLAERFGKAPKPRMVPAKILNPEPTVKASYTPPPVLPSQAARVKLAAPAERIPFDLGLGADKIQLRPTLPIAAGITERARDVNLPPALPTLGRPLNDRVGLDDPTSEFANAAIVAPVIKPTLGSAAFVKVTVPDPFELGEQVKPKVPPTAEPGLTPAPVNPQRVK